MGLQADYAASYRKELKRYPVWEPGAPVELGDYGLLRHGTFEKLGNVREFNVTFSTKRGGPHGFQFAGKGTAVAYVGGNASLGAEGAAPVGQASLAIRFAEDHALFIRAQKSHEETVESVREMALNIRTHTKWNHSWKVVVGLRYAAPMTVIMSSAGGNFITIEGSSKALEELDAGSLGSEAGLKITGDVGYKVIGVSGPLHMDLVRVRRFLSPVRGAGSVGNVEMPPFEEVDADVSQGDDA